MQKCWIIIKNKLINLLNVISIEFNDEIVHINLPGDDVSVSIFEFKQAMATALNYPDIPEIKPYVEHDSVMTIINQRALKSFNVTAKGNDRGTTLIAEAVSGNGKHLEDVLDDLCDVIDQVQNKGINFVIDVGIKRPGDVDFIYGANRKTVTGFLKAHVGYSDAIINSIRVRDGELASNQPQCVRTVYIDVMIDDNRFTFVTHNDLLYVELGKGCTYSTAIKEIISLKDVYFNVLVKFSDGVTATWFEVNKPGIIGYTPQIGDSALHSLIVSKCTISPDGFSEGHRKFDLCMTLDVKSTDSITQLAGDSVTPHKVHLS